MKRMLVLAMAAWGMAGVTAVGMIAFVVVLLVTFGHSTRRMTLEVLLFGVFMIAYHGGLWFLAAHEQRYPDRLKVYRIAAQVIAEVEQGGDLNQLEDEVKKI